MHEGACPETQYGIEIIIHRATCSQEVGLNQQGPGLTSLAWLKGGKKKGAFLLTSLGK